MMKTLAIILAMASVSLVVTQVAAIGVLWQRGILNPTVLHEIQLVLAGQPPSSEPIETTDEQPESPVVTLDEVLKTRSTRILDLQTREAELSLLKKTALTLANNLISQQERFDQEKGKFQQELAAHQQQLQSDAVQQARAIVLAAAPEEAVARLMSLTLEENLVILSGLPEKSIVKILREFRGAPEVVERGQKVFAGLARGEPLKTTLQQADNRQAQGDGQPAGQ